MLLANTTNKLSVLIFTLLIVTAATAQENSPYSRYGIGDLSNTKHVTQRAQGGLDVVNNDPFAVNFNNPASYNRLFRVTYDIGVLLDNRVLKSQNPDGKYKSTNLVPSYITLGLPLSVKKHLGLAIGLKPYSRVNYDITKAGRVAGIDSLYQYFIGTGGLNQAYVGIGKGWGADTAKQHFSLGLNFGYMFGKKQTETRTEFLADSSYIFYTKSNSQTRTNYGNTFFQAGAQYDLELSRTQSKMATNSKQVLVLTLGANAMFKQSFNATQDTLRETYIYDGNGGTVNLDTVLSNEGAKIKVELPATYTFGFAIKKKELNGSIDKWMIGAQYTMAKFTDYRFGGQKDALADFWNASIGGFYVPKPGDTKLFNRTTYRLGFSMGKDYINVDGNELKTMSGTIGFSFPLRNYTSWTQQFTIINTAFEVGKRGSNKNNLTDSYFKFSVGLSLSDLWFNKRKYD